MRNALLLSMLVVATAACTHDSDDESAKAPSRVAAGRITLTEDDRRSLDLRVAPAVLEDLPDAALRFGRVRARPGEDALVVSPVEGRIARAPAAKLGDPVKTGQKLLEIVPLLPAEARVSVGMAAAEIDGRIASSEKELAQHEADLARTRELAGAGVESKEKLLAAETLVETTRATLAALKRARATGGGGDGMPITLTAPMAGVLVSLESAVGQAVKPGDVLAHVIERGPRWIDVAVAPDDPAGTRYEVEVAGRYVPARLVAKGAVADADGSRHDRIEVSEADGAALLAGSIAPVRISRGNSTGVVVPESAIVPVAAGEVVFVESSGGSYAMTPVVVAARFGGKARIARGLAPGAKVVVRGAMALSGETLRGALQED